MLWDPWEKVYWLIVCNRTVGEALQMVMANHSLLKIVFQLNNRGEKQWLFFLFEVIIIQWFCSVLLFVDFIV